MFGDFDDHIYPIELEIKDTTDTTKSASSLDLHQGNPDRNHNSGISDQFRDIYSICRCLWNVAT
jgi:hypothetical protein